MQDILNAAPMVIDLGTQDLSTREVPLNSLNIPQHLPKLYIFAEKGPIGSNYVDMLASSVTQLYGDETFNLLNKYFSHQTVFVNAIASAGNNCVIHRVMPDDAKDVANVVMYLDILPTQVPLYQKNALDGSLVLDGSGLPTPQLDGSGNPVNIPGYKVKWVVDHTEAPTGTYTPGLKTIRPGTQLDTITSVQSTQIPIFEYFAKYAGEYGNKLALRMFPALRTDLLPFPDYVLTDMKNFPYYFQMVKLVNPETGKVEPVVGTSLTTTSRFILDNSIRDINTEERAGLETMVNTGKVEYALPEETRMLGGIYVYKTNMTGTLQQLYDAEKIISDTHKDSVINNTDNNIYALNILSFVNSNGSPYQSIKLVDSNDSVRLTKNTNVFLKGADDGTISLSVLDQLVAEDLDHYNNSIHEYNDLVMHPESIIYDSGFTLATKKAFPKFISRRKDTFVVLSTTAHDNTSQDLNSQYSVGVALKTILELYPESSFFGTPVMRGMISIGSGKLIGSNYDIRVPLTYEIAHKAARYMGASTAAWKSGFCFDHAPNSVVTQLKDIDITWVPASTRNTLWTVGLNFVLNYKVRTQFFPAMKTVYENDTSVLNSFFTAVAIAYLSKVMHASWREYSGAISYTSAQLEEAVNNFIAAAVKDKFDNKFVVVPNCTTTELDLLRGYSWSTNIKLYANTQKTVSTSYVTAFRISDLAQ
jgi:hypothetical protein